jgi:hypothetical protein
MELEVWYHFVVSNVKFSHLQLGYGPIRNKIVTYFCQYSRLESVLLVNLLFGKAYGSEICFHVCWHVLSLAILKGT